MTPDLLYRILPYGAQLLFCIGALVNTGWVWWKYPGVSAAPAQVLRPFLGGALWRFGFIAVVLVHAVVLGFPERVLAWNGAIPRLYLLEFTALAAGVVALVGWLQVLRRHVSEPVSTLREAADSILLSVIGVTLASGLVMAWTHRWASSWAASTLAPYTRS